MTNSTQNPLEKERASMTDSGTPTSPGSEDAYRVVVEHGWSYVVGNPTPRDSGPWRYQWEAQEYADDLNAGRVQP